MEAIHNNATSPELIEELAIEFLECLPPKLKQYMLTDKDIAFAENSSVTVIPGPDRSIPFLE